MEAKNHQTTGEQKNKKKLILVGLTILAVALCVIIAMLLTSPKRSVAAFCTTLTEEKARLAKLPGDTWPSGVFNESLGDASEFVASLGKLEAVAPENIRADITTLKSIYQKIHDDPSQAIGASMSGAKAEQNVKDWASENCGE
jgi:hypothetical protein